MPRMTCARVPTDLTGEAATAVRSAENEHAVAEITAAANTNAHQTLNAFMTHSPSINVCLLGCVGLRGETRVSCCWRQQQECQPVDVVAGASASQAFSRPPRAQSIRECGVPACRGASRYEPRRRNAAG